MPFRVRVVSERFPTRMSVLRTDLGDPREVERFRLPPGVREGEWDGRAVKRHLVHHKVAVMFIPPP